MKTVSELWEYYKLYRRDRGWREYERAFGVRTLVEYLLNYSKDATIVDFGCGLGRFVDHLRSAGYKNAVGIDLFPSDSPSLYVYSDFSKIEFETSSVDAGISLWALGVYGNKKEDILSHFKEAHRIIKNGGRLMLFMQQNSSDFLRCRTNLSLQYDEEDPLIMKEKYVFDFLNIEETKTSQISLLEIESLGFVIKKIIHRSLVILLLEVGKEP